MSKTTSNPSVVVPGREINVPAHTPGFMLIDEAIERLNDPIRQLEELQSLINGTPAEQPMESTMGGHSSLNELLNNGASRIGSYTNRLNELIEELRVTLYGQ